MYVSSSYAHQNAIREKNQALNYLRLSSRIDAVGARLESAIRMKQVRKDVSVCQSGKEGGSDDTPRPLIFVLTACLNE